MGANVLADASILKNLRRFRNSLSYYRNQRGLDLGSGKDRFKSIWARRMARNADPTDTTLNLQPPASRSVRERVAQTFGFEVSGLIISLPFLSLFSKGSPVENALVLASITLAVMIWTPFHNALFDHLDFRFSGRVASDRRQVWRVVHALSHELTSILVSLPILILLAGLDWKTAIYVDLGLSAIYALWAWAFYLIWDRLRPLASP